FAEQVSLTDDEIVKFLSGSEIRGNQKGTKWRQTFTADGETYYEETNGFRPSFGQWKALNNEYCSVWPPSAIWSCYKMTAEGEELTFIPHKGDAWPAVRVKKNQ
ncbi:MAG: hypothetical protein KTR18_12340, partial [Acidiferrobacterales bacterium]|nr:hypothetical protein [Acidiferrobacterales bacterium]